MSTPPAGQATSMNARCCWRLLNIARNWNGVSLRFSIRSGTTGIHLCSMPAGRATREPGRPSPEAILAKHLFGAGKRIGFARRLSTRLPRTLDEPLAAARQLGRGGNGLLDRRVPALGNVPDACGGFHPKLPQERSPPSTASPNPPAGSSPGPPPNRFRRAASSSRIPRRSAATGPRPSPPATRSPPRHAAATAEG